MNELCIIKLIMSAFNDATAENPGQGYVDERKVNKTSQN